MGGLGVWGAVTAPALAAEPDELPSGLGLSFISKRRQMVGLALAQPPQPPKVCFRDGCGERERCRGGRGTSAGDDKVGGGGGCGGGGGRRRLFAAAAAATAATDVRASVSLIPSHLLALVFLPLPPYQSDTFQRRADI